MNCPNQYTRKHSTLRRICAAIDEHGPMTLEILSETLHTSYTSIRGKSHLGAIDGYLILSPKRFGNGKGRPQILVSRTSEVLPAPTESPYNERRRELKRIRRDEEMRAQGKPVIRRDPFIEAMYGAAA